jgi:hypothetical protein
MMKIADLNNLDLNVAVGRVLLAVLALASWYVDPANGRWFFIDESSLAVLTLHLTYSLTIIRADPSWHRGFAIAGNRHDSRRSVCRRDLH